jgi:uncharacterized damage-inducible protein DinB
MTDDPFASPEIETFWGYIATSLDRLVEVGGSLDPDGLHWRPPAPGANSVAILVHHTLSNAEGNLLGTLAGEDVKRDREAEFAEGEGTGADLVDEWRILRARFERSLRGVDAAEMERQRPHPRRGSVNGREVLIVVARHAAEHMGQAELTRDLWLASRSTG